MELKIQETRRPFGRARSFVTLGLRQTPHCNCLTHRTTSLVRTTSRRFYCDRTDMKWPGRSRLFAGARRAKLHLPGGSTLHEPERHQPVPVIHFPRSPRRAATNESATMPHNDNYSAIELSLIFYGWRNMIASANTPDLITIDVYFTI